MIKKIKLKPKEIAQIMMFSSLYVFLTIIFSPISYNALQFRISGIIRPAIAKKKIFIVGYSLGVFISNYFSPFVGLYELIFMPIMAFLAGQTGYYLSNKYNNSYFVAGIIIAIIISFSVSFMLLQLFNISMILTLPALLVSELLINLIGVFFFKLIDMRINLWSI